MKTIKFVLAFLSIVVLSSFNNSNRKIFTPIKSNNQAIFSVPTLGLNGTIPSGVTISRITYDDPNYNTVGQNYPNSTNFFNRDAAESNEISIKIYGSFNSVYIITGSSIIDQQFYTSGSPNTFYFNVSLSPNTSYEIVVN